MFLQAVWRLSKLGFVNFRRNIGLNIVATFVMSLTLMTISSMVVAALLVQAEITQIENKIDLEIFFNNTISEDKLNTLKDAIKNTAEVKEIQYVDKKMAVERYKKIFGDRDVLINYIEQENPLKESLVVRTANPSDLEKINRLIQTEEFKPLVYSSSYSQNRAIITKLIGIIDFVEKAGVVIGLVFILIAVMVVFGTVTIAIYTRKDEIEIMKLVGATDWFVHMPFLIESALIGIFGSLFSTGLVLVVFYYVSLAANSYLAVPSDFLYNYLINYAVFLFLMQVLIGILISVSSAFVAIRKHL